MSQPQSAVVVAAVDMWKTVTAAQIGAATGAGGIAFPRPRDAWGAKNRDGAGRITLGLRGRGLAWSPHPLAPPEPEQLPGRQSPYRQGWVRVGALDTEEA
jgi:hypothetical protein